MSYATTAEELRKLAELKVRQATAACSKFATDFAEDPAYALTWSASVFAAAATRQVWMRIAADVDRVLAAPTPHANADNVVRLLRAQTRRDVLRKAQHPAASTSVPSNLMEQQMLAAMAGVLDGLSGIGADDDA